MNNFRIIILVRNVDLKNYAMLFVTEQEHLVMSVIFI